MLLSVGTLVAFEISGGQTEELAYCSRRVAATSVIQVQSLLDEKCLQ